MNVRIVQLLRKKKWYLTYVLICTVCGEIFPHIYQSLHLWVHGFTPKSIV